MLNLYSPTENNASPNFGQLTRIEIPLCRYEMCQKTLRLQTSASFKLLVAALPLPPLDETLQRTPSKTHFI